MFLDYNKTGVLRVGVGSGGGIIFTAPYKCRVEIELISIFAPSGTAGRDGGSGGLYIVPPGYTFTTGGAGTQAVLPCIMSMNANSTSLAAGVPSPDTVTTNFSSAIMGVNYVIREDFNLGAVDLDIVIHYWRLPEIV